MNIPHHLGIIIDGNRRWAREKNLPTLEGHRRGYNNIRTIGEYAWQKGIKILTVYCFSSENWNRERSEVKYLMELLGLGLAQKSIQYYHDRGIKILARAFRDSGMEVIYLGLRQTPKMIVNAAIQEDADVIALSILSGAHMTIFKKVNQLLKENNINNILITGGGIIPQSDMDVLHQDGIGKLFGPGTVIQEIVDYINDWSKNNR